MIRSIGIYSFSFYRDFVLRQPLINCWKYFMKLGFATALLLLAIETHSLNPFLARMNHKTTLLQCAEVFPPDLSIHLQQMQEGNEEPRTILRINKPLPYEIEIPEIAWPLFPHIQNPNQLNNKKQGLWEAFESRVCQQNINKTCTPKCLILPLHFFPPLFLILIFFFFGSIFHCSTKKPIVS
jgi:hypothetical protein